MSTLPALVWIALGGAAGSVARALVAQSLPARFPWATLLVNGLGSLLIGWLMARLGPGETGTAAALRHLLVAGFCGGFTTFSALALEVNTLVERRAYGPATLYLAITLVGGVAACAAGLWLGRQLTP